MSSIALDSNRYVIPNSNPPVEKNDKISIGFKLLTNNTQITNPNEELKCHKLYYSTGGY